MTGSVGLYIFEMPPDFAGARLEAALRCVDEARRHKALGYVHESDQALSVAAWLMLRHALRHSFGIDVVPPISTGPYGKPEFPDMPHIHFNLSHCRRAVACAVGPAPVGVDIEDFDSFHPDLLAETLSEAERAEVASAECPDREFICRWTMKESLAKYAGTGIAGALPGPHQAPDVSVTTISSPDGYVSSVCHPAQFNLRIHHVTKKEIFDGTPVTF